MHSRSNRNTNASSIIETIQKGVSENERQQASKFRENYIASTTHARVQERWKNSHKRQKTILKLCKPYHSWEKGTVENINGLIRRFFSKGTDFDTITEEQIAYVEDCRGKC